MGFIFQKSERMFLHRTFGKFILKWRWKGKFQQLLFSKTKVKYLSMCFLLYWISNLFEATEAYPLFSSQSECDWNGRGTGTSWSGGGGSMSIQTMTLGCTRGEIHWEEGKGGLRVQISPNIPPPYKLCLQDTPPKTKSSNSSLRKHRILLEEPSGRLLQVLSSEMKNSDCYRISEPSAIFYVESHTGQILRSQVNQVMSANERRGESIPPISIAYEVETLRGDGDPCRPCSEAETLKAYCTADVVARGSILQIVPGKLTDWIYIKSDLILHQNQPVFTKFSSAMYKFLMKKPKKFDMDKPQKMTEMREGEFYEGIISHPSSCSASVGDGDFLWLIKFRFGRPMTECVLYWDKWVDIAQRDQGECPLSTGQDN